MRAVVVSLFVLGVAVLPAHAQDVLPSRTLELPLALVIPPPLVDFDLLDQQEEEFVQQHAVPDKDPHTIFAIKTHVGGAFGWDNGNPHGSIGLYLTVAEWGRWNFGVPAAALGFSRYHVFDRQVGRAVQKDEMTVMVSMASVHYRLGYIRSWGLNWYINLEQMYDMRTNMAGSQYGISFSRK